jgi:hypothetical protein
MNVEQDDVRIPLSKEAIRQFPNTPSRKLSRPGTKITRDAVTGDMVNIEYNADTRESDNYQLQSCCTRRTSDRRLLTFIASLSLSSIIVIFSCHMLSRDHISCSSENTYVGLISLILGVWLRSPAQ